MDELFEALTLVQTRKVRNFPLVLFGSGYWGGLYDWLRNTMAPAGNITLEDLDFCRVTDSPEEAVRIITECYQRNCTEPSLEPTDAELRRAIPRVKAKRAPRSRN